MSKNGLDLLSQKVTDKLLVMDKIEAPEKFTDEEIGIIKQYHPTDIDFDTKGLPQEAFWYISLNREAGQAVNVRFGKRYMDFSGQYAWYVFVQGKGPKGEISFEETTPPSDLPLDIEPGITLLKKYLDSYNIREEEKKESNLPSQDEKIKYKKELTTLIKTVNKAWNFVNSGTQEFQFKEITNHISELQKKFPNKRTEIQRLNNKMKQVINARMKFEDSYYQLKSEAQRLK